MSYREGRHSRLNDESIIAAEDKLRRLYSEPSEPQRPDMPNAILVSGLTLCLLGAVLGTMMAW